MTITRRTLLRGLVAAAAVPVLAPSPAFAAARKWHPGHYLWPAGTRWSADVRKSHFAALDAVAANPYVTGIKIAFDWADFEGAKGDYTAGFRILDAYLDKLDSVGKYLMVQVNERSFGNPGPGVYPRYIVDNGWVIARPGGESWTGNLASTARMWQPAVMDRLIALSHAFATRYDGHPRFEQFSLGETAMGVPGGYGFSTEAWRAQLKRWFTESKRAWTNTYLRLNANFISNDEAMRDLITHCARGGGVTVGGPNPEPPVLSITRFITANRVFRGDDGGTDLRGTIPWTGEVRAANLGARFTQTPEEIFDYFYATMRASHMVWPHNTSTGGAAQRWSTGILPYINSIRGRTNTSRPTTAG
ncbi:hypothetical protein [Actinophytocola sp.]|uniref:hypothetical protein n=1 Tax=Actinophytocola sp. TaxID=1872138 RepID=UPI003899E370